MPAAPGKKAASDWVLRSLAGRSRRTAGESSSQAMKGAGACSESCCRWWLTPPRSVKAEPRRSKRWLGCEKIDLRALGDERYRCCRQVQRSDTLYTCVEGSSAQAGIVMIVCQIQREQPCESR